MTKNELYTTLISLENMDRVKDEKEYWQAIAYLYYCNDTILHFQDEQFTKRLLTLIENSQIKFDFHTQDCNYKCNEWIYGSDYYQYGISPEGPKFRDLHSEFIPRALQKALNI